METYLFFGSFNPIHKGHVALIQYILGHTKSNIWIIVSPHNPHKDPKILASFSDRYNMVKLATLEFGERVFVSNIEESMSKPSYTINTIKKLIQLNPDKRFCLLAGSDIANTIHTWYKYDELKTLIDIKIYPRKESDRYLCSSELMNAPITMCSSTDFRSSKNYDILNSSVTEYIKDKELYL